MSTTTLATTKGKELALAALKQRREENATVVQIDNSKLYAGSPMYFYCISCAGLADRLPESFTCTPKRLCEECQALKDMGWLE